MEIIQNNAVSVIDKKVDDIKNELNKLRQATKLIPILESDLKTLESAKLILIGKNGSDREIKIVIETPIKRQRARNPNSIGALTVQIIKEAGNPLHVKDIVSKLAEKKKKATTVTVTGACVRLEREGVLKRTYPNTFDLVNNGQNL